MNAKEPEMTNVQRVEDQVRRLTPAELARFRAWFASYDADAWDEELAADAAAGLLDAAADAALGEHKAGRSQPL